MLNKQLNPWLDPLNENWLKNEIDIVKDRANLGHFIPDKAVEWLCKKNQDKRVFDALTKLAPAYPLASFHSEPSIWLSPPISGVNNEVVIIMGKDQGRVRMVGCNFCGVYLTTSTTKKHPNFWADYDACQNDLAKYRLISAFVTENFDHISLTQAKDVDNQCFDFRTMPLYIVCIDAGHVYIWSMPCLIWPIVCPSAMTLEMVKEF